MTRSLELARRPVRIDTQHFQKSKVHPGIWTPARLDRMPSLYHLPRRELPLDQSAKATTKFKNEHPSFYFSINCHFDEYVSYVINSAEAVRSIARYIALKK